MHHLLTDLNDGPARPQTRSVAAMAALSCAESPRAPSVKQVQCRVAYAERNRSAGEPELRPRSDVKDLKQGFIWGTKHLFLVETG